MFSQVEKTYDESKIVCTASPKVEHPIDAIHLYTFPVLGLYEILLEQNEDH
jgi:hypothetical protein